MLRLKELRKKHNLTQAQLAKKIGVSQPTYSSWEREEVRIDYETLLYLAAIFHVSVSYLIGAGDIRKDINWSRLGIYKTARSIDDKRNIDIFEDELIPPHMAVSGEFFAVRVKGDSMAPRMLDGDAVIARRQYDCENGDIAIVTAKDGFSVMKEIKKTEDGITLTSFNSSYESIYFSNDDIEKNNVKIIGKAVELRGKL